MRQPAFTKSKESYGWPEPTCLDLKSLSDLDLADYIAVCGFDYDGMPRAAREALVRLLRRPSFPNGE